MSSLLDCKGVELVGFLMCKGQLSNKTIMSMLMRIVVTETLIIELLMVDLDMLEIVNKKEVENSC